MRGSRKLAGTASRWSRRSPPMRPCGNRRSAHSFRSAMALKSTCARKKVLTASIAPVPGIARVHLGRIQLRKGLAQFDLAVGERDDDRCDLHLGQSLLLGETDLARGGGR